MPPFEAPPTQPAEPAVPLAPGQMPPLQSAARTELLRASLVKKPLGDQPASATPQPAGATPAAPPRVR
jgi:hypothetical protein